MRYQDVRCDHGDGALYRRKRPLCKKDTPNVKSRNVPLEGHLDDKETCFMLNDVIYHQYLETEKAYLEQKKSEEQAKQMPDKGTTQDATQTEREQELHSMVAEGWNASDICGI